MVKIYCKGIFSHSNLLSAIFTHSSVIETNAAKLMTNLSFHLTVTAKSNHA